MEKYEIKITYNTDETTFKISKTSSLDKLCKFIEMYYEELKMTNYQI